ncbi:MAG: DUF6457 domain-containing protein [Actinobacteria bacterium]|nr:DUF6457 domain-containing protein [Actinomycetota bacterium]MCL5446627.1 DUF6457 domain-containing protein [Actinomycetota bacterium]
MMNRAEWIQAFADALDAAMLPEEEVELVLSLASEAAHGSERAAAPLACWIAGRSGASPARALEVARKLADDAVRD